MSILSITLKSLLALGAVTALTITASADDPKPKTPIAKAQATGGGAGKATFKEFTVTDTDKIGDIKGESQATINEGCEPYPACARNKEAMKEEIAAPIKFDGLDGEDRLTENLSIASGPNGMMPEVDLDAPRPQGGDDPIPGIDIIIREDAICTPYPECDRVVPIAAPNTLDGEDRLTENVSIGSDQDGQLPEAEEDAAEPTIDTKDFPLRPRPMQRR